MGRDHSARMASSAAKFVSKGSGRDQNRLTAARLERANAATADQEVAAATASEEVATVADEDVVARAAENVLDVEDAGLDAPCEPNWS